MYGTQWPTSSQKLIQHQFVGDTGSAREQLETNPEFAGFNLSDLPADWTSKKGFYAPDAASLANRARFVRRFLRDRPEKDIVLVCHGDFLRQLTCDASGPSHIFWKNAESILWKVIVLLSVESPRVSLHPEVKSPNGRR